MEFIGILRELDHMAPHITWTSTESVSKVKKRQGFKSPKQLET